MFDIREPGSAPGSTIPVPDAPVPLERLEVQICELAGHLTAATCRFLVLLADFDARRGWASWEMNSCAQWLSWKCQMSAGTAREYVRVARALRDLPVIRAGFAATRLSYAKVRALTRIATPETEEGLAEIAGPMTGNQLERFARAHRQVTSADDAAARVRRRLAWRLEEDGSLAGTFRLPPLVGAVLLKALRAAAGDLEHPHHGETEAISAETPADGKAAVQTSSSLADALLAVAEAFLAAKAGIPPSPAVPPPGGTIGDCHDADITPDTIIPPWYGERLDLDYAIYTCFANARSQQERQDQRDRLDEAEMFQPRAWVAELSDSIDWIRRQCDENAAA